MDPLNVLAGPGVLKCVPLTRDGMDLALELPELKRWRRDGLAVEARMVRIGEQKICHAWPHSLQFVANGSEVFSVTPPADGHKRRDVPQQVSAGLRPGANSISVRAQDEQADDFLLAVVLTAPVGLAELQRQVAKILFRESIRWDVKLMSLGRRSGSGVECLSGHTLRLRCPITMERIQEPVRGRNCQHLQCFGLEAYLTSNMQMRAFNNRWTCPVCSQRTLPAELRRDSYVVSVLAEAPEDVEEVVLRQVDKQTMSWARAAGPSAGGAAGPSPKQEVPCLDAPSPQRQPAGSGGRSESAAQLDPHNGKLLDYHPVAISPPTRAVPAGASSAPPPAVSTPAARGPRAAAAATSPTALGAEGATPPPPAAKASRGRGAGGAGKPGRGKRTSPRGGLAATRDWPPTLQQQQQQQTLARWAKRIRANDSQGLPGPGDSDARTLAAP